MEERTYTRREMLERVAGLAIIGALGGRELYKWYQRRQNEKGVAYTPALEQERQKELDSIVDTYSPESRNQSIILYDHSFEKLQQNASLEERSAYSSNSVQMSGELVHSTNPPKSTIYVSQILWRPDISTSTEDRASHMIRILYRSTMGLNFDKQPWSHKQLDATFTGETSKEQNLRGAQEAMEVQRNLIGPLMAYDHQLETILKEKPAVSPLLRSLVINNEQYLMSKLREYDVNTTHPFVRIFVVEALAYLSHRPTMKILDH